VFAIPPVKTFLTRYREDFIRLTGDEQAKLDTFAKRAIGAFWGMVFKFVLGYTEQKSVSVSMNEYFMVRTASVYGGRPEDLIIGIGILGVLHDYVGMRDGYVFAGKPYAGRGRCGDCCRYGGLALAAVTLNQADCAARNVRFP
jgi:hypothetical protein